ncbi:MAG: protein kinase [Myxococcota bacterium]|nr:protein kinase [Myxococcota bacterium]
MTARFHKLGPLMSGENSRAILAIAKAAAGHGVPEPRVLIWLHEDVTRDPDAMQAVRRETTRAEQLDHPNIVRVYGLTEEPEGIARVVEFADAESLRRILQAAEALTPALASRIVADLATGVHYAHLAGNDDGTPLVHGDLRPETVLIGYSGASKVGGYGALAAAPREPGGRRVQGRRQHCAPEQVVGGREAVNVQTDVYLLGVLLYELLSGKVPYSELPANEFDGAVLTYPPPPLPVGERPPELEAVLRRAMAKKAFDRYPTPLALRDAIERAMDGAMAPVEEVARFVNELFPEEGSSSPRAARRQMIAEAITRAQEEAAPSAPVQAQPSGPVVPPAAPVDRPAPEPVVPAAAPASRPALDPLVAEAASPSSPEPVVQQPASDDRAPRRSWALPVGVLLALVAAGGIWAWQGSRSPVEVTDSTGVDAGAPAQTDAGALAEVTPAPAEVVADAGAEEAVTYLEVFVDPSVEVLIDGKEMGRSPVKVVVEPGRRTVQLLDRKKLINLTRYVDVQQAGARREFYLNRGYVNISAPDGSEILIDGKSFGVAPVKEIGLYEGFHQLKVEVGDLRWQESFTLKPNERVRFDVDFQ